MKIGRKSESRYCIASAPIFITAFLIFSIFVETHQQQRDIKSKWDNRLLPTNSVYEKNQEFVSNSGNVVAPSSSSLSQNHVMENSKGIENSSSYEIDNNEEDETYDDDYELEDTGSNRQGQKDTSESSLISSGSISHEDKIQSKESSLENTRDSPVDHEDDAYYYYDDYENATNPQNDASEHDIADYFDSSEDVAVAIKAENNGDSSESLPKDISEPIKYSSVEESSEMSTSTSNGSSPAEKMMESDAEDGIGHRGSTKLVEDGIAADKSREHRDEQILIGEAVVSVVTTKSVVNGTFSVPETSRSITTEQITSPMIPSSTPDPGMIFTGETTEDSRIVASVQTSRSISGARFLPFLVVQAIDKNSDKKNNEKTASLSSDETTESIDQLEKKVENDGDKENVEMELSTTTKKSAVPSESTESIIDKLDRVQSELSSGFLANGFRTSGNTLQLDALSEQRPVQTRKSYTTTSRTPVISKFVPRRYNQDKKSTVSTTTPAKVTEALTNEDNTGNSEKVKFRWPSSSRNSRPPSTEGTSVNNNNNNNNNNNANKYSNPRPFGSNAPAKTTARPSSPPSQDISAFLPPGYKLKKEDAQVVTEKSLLSEILAKSKFDISSLLPANYEAPQVENSRDSDEETKKDNGGKEFEKNLANLFGKSSDDTKSSIYSDDSKAQTNRDYPESSGTMETSAKPGKSLQDLFSKATVDISALLPPGYNKFRVHDKSDKTTTTSQPETVKESSTLSPTLATTVKSAGGIKLVFPSRPGGRKALPKVSTSTHRAEGSGPVSPRIQKGWPTRATTEFTGWPTPSTTPISIEKLLEAARTATVSPINVSMVTMTQTSSTTSTSTTTTTTQRPTTPGICEEECEVAGTIKIIGNATWVPELLDRNTKEWQLLAEEIEQEMNLVFSTSSVLKKWYKHVRIDAFSPGSILVDYFIELSDLNERINTQELKVIFHDSLRTYNSDVWNETRAKGPIRLGNFSLDPKSTDFVVIPKVTYPQQIQDDDRLIPQWAIAVIVIGVGGLLFIIVFGVSVLVNRQNASKLKPSPVVYTEEVAKNIIQASHAASHRSSQDYPKSEISTIWNDTELWRDKSFESNSNEVLVDGTLDRERNPERRRGERKYNMYDSWRSEWNGYYYNPSQSSKFAGYESTTNLSRHPPDYDTNF